MEILMSRYAMVYDTASGTVVDKRRAKLYAAKRRPPMGSRLVHDESCRAARCMDVDHLSAEPLIDPPPEPEHGRAWRRAIVTEVRPHPGAPWSATFETSDRREAIPLYPRVLEALRLAEGGSAALECEAFLHLPALGPTEVYPIPSTDEWLPDGFPGAVELVPAGRLQPSDPCACLGGRAFGTCHGTPRATGAYLHHA